MAGGSSTLSKLSETWPPVIAQALHQPSGARFYRCALQVNPFEYVKRHKKTTTFLDESSYNTAFIQACKDNNIEVIAITDHYRVKTANSLAEAALKAGLHVFRGFEAVTKDGIHILCFCDVSKGIETIDRIIGDCGIHSETEDSPLGKYDAEEFLKESHGWKAVCIAAHVASKGGLLHALSGKARAQAWRSPHLLACSLPGPLSAAPTNIRPILENKNADYRRAHPVAIINAQDVSDPTDLNKPESSCWIKMSEVSVDGLRQAFFDASSRIRLNSDPTPDGHTQLVAVAWEGGFLDTCSIHFNESLNVLIGGRGSGKSTVIESLRYVLGLQPLGADAKKIFDGITKNVLKDGTKTSLLVRSHYPAERYYLIERIIPHLPIIRDSSGNLINNITPTDILPRIEVYGQHEISELTKDREKLTLLLHRFVQHDPTLEQRKRQILRDLERSRSTQIETRNSIEAIEDQLSQLPSLEEKLTRFQEAGFEENFKDHSWLIKEGQLLKTAEEVPLSFAGEIQRLKKLLPFETSAFSEDAILGLPGATSIRRAKTIIDSLSKLLDEQLHSIESSLQKATDDLVAVRTKWEEREKAVQEEYEKTLRKLQTTHTGSEEYIGLRQRIEELRPLRQKQENLQKELKNQEDERKNFVDKWENIKAEEFRNLERAAKKVSKQLSGRVQVEVKFASNRDRLTEHIRTLGGRVAGIITALASRDSLSLSELAAACRIGHAALAEQFKIPPKQAEILAATTPDFIMKIEELDLPASTIIKLNIAPEGESPQWQALDDLSTGQKATAILLLLLLQSDVPLIIDQPEDDLDNRFITDGIVPKMREEKQLRQFIFSTHNANIPVLADAELIIGLAASGEAERGRAEMLTKYMGSIDSAPVRELVGELLEGGKEAFEKRRLKYGY